MQQGAPNILNQVNDFIKEGMSILRLNGAHNDISWHANVIQKVKCPVLFDLPGFKIRLQLKHPIKLKKGDMFNIQKEQTTFPELYRYVEPGQILLIQDKSYLFKIDDIRDQTILCTAQTDAYLQHNKGVLTPNSFIPFEFPTQKDFSCIDMLKKKSTAYVGVSFTQSKKQIETLKGMLKCIIVAKIEDQKGLDNLEGIQNTADMMMIARGDLANNIGIENIGMAQKYIMQKVYTKPILIATQLLYSMLDNDTPTRAEVCDVTNAILDGAFGLILSDETTLGHYPFQAISILRKIIEVVKA